MNGTGFLIWNPIRGRMFFSIVIPAYNAADSISETLKSVEQQSFDDFEIILVDDGSTDKTYEIMSIFASHCNRAKLINQSNSGVFEARRTGVDASIGEYIVFLDADDCLRNTALQTIAEALAHQKADIASFCYTRNSNYSRDMLISPSLPPSYYAGEELLRVKRQVSMCRLNSVWAKAIKRSLFQTREQRNSYPRIGFGEDLLQTLELIDACESFLQMKDILYYYKNDDSETATSSFKSSQLEDIQYVTSRLISYAGKWGGDCRDLALRGRVEQYLYLIQINETSTNARNNKKENFAEICAFMKADGVLAESSKVELRIDYRLLLLAISRKSYKLASAVIRLREQIKGIVSKNN